MRRSAVALERAWLLSLCCGIGLGAFQLPVTLVARWPADLGGNVPLAFALAAIPAVAVALVSGALVARTPGPGGDYDFIAPVLGRRAAVLFTMPDAIALVLAMAGATLTCVRLLHAVVPVAEPILGAGLLAAAFAVTWLGVERSTGLCTLAATMALGALLAHAMPATPASAPLAAAEPGTARGLAVATAVLSFAFAGLTIGQHALDTRVGTPRTRAVTVAMPTFLAAGYYVLLGRTLVRHVPAAAFATAPAAATVLDVVWRTPPGVPLVATALLVLALWDNVWAMAFRVTRLAWAWERDRGAARPTIRPMVAVVYAAAAAIAALLHRAEVGAVSAPTGCLVAVGIGFAGRRAGRARRGTEAVLLLAGGGIAVFAALASAVVLGFTAPGAALGAVLVVALVVLGLSTPVRTLPGHRATSAPTSRAKPWPTLSDDEIRVAMALRSDIWAPWPSLAAELGLPQDRFEDVAAGLIGRGLVLPVVFLNWNRVPYVVHPCLVRYRATADEPSRRALCHRLAGSPDRVFVEEVERDTLAVGFTTGLGDGFPAERAQALLDPDVVESIAVTRQLFFFKEAGLHFTDARWGTIEYLLHCRGGEPRYGRYRAAATASATALQTEIAQARARWSTLSPLEQRMLDFLLFRPLLPNEPLAELCRAPVEAVARARRRLIAERLVAPSAYFLDSGYHYFQVYLRFTEPYATPPVATLIARLVADPFFCVAALLEGAHDFVLGVHCDDEDVLARRLERLADERAIANVDAYRVKWTYKHNTLLRSLGNMTRPDFPRDGLPEDGGALNHLPWRAAGAS